MWKKYKRTGIEFSAVYFNSTTKTVIDYKFNLDKSFKEILYRNNNWISERSGWIVESTKSHHINNSTYRPLFRSSYIKLPVELKSQKQKNNNNNNKKKSTSKIMITKVFFGAMLGILI